MTCPIQQHGSVELFFYDELDPAARAEMTTHLRQCRECALALEELTMIRDVLAVRPDVSAPPAGDWSGFMRRLDTRLHADDGVASGFSRTHSEPRRGSVVRLKPDATDVRLKPDATDVRLKPDLPDVKRDATRDARGRSYVGLFATAALLAIVTLSVYFVAQGPSPHVAEPTSVVGGEQGQATPVATAGLKAVGEQHFERSKLVVLGLAAKEPAQTGVEDWAYERELASSLLSDTRLYRLAAEERGFTSLAGVMRDLELVLLETSMAREDDSRALGQIQRLIEKRGLIEKMEAVATAGM